jgi:predicted nucleic acid-binding protein
MKKKQKIYLDTSVISHFDAPDVPEKMEETRELWKLLEENIMFEIVTSVVTQTEIDFCFEPKRSEMITLLTSINCRILHETPEVISLVDEFINFGVLSHRHYNDLLHIAYAVAEQCDCIVSWNFKHFVNINTIDRVNAVNLINGYPPVKIVSPPMIQRGKYDE